MLGTALVFEVTREMLLAFVIPWAVSSLDAYRLADMLPGLSRARIAVPMFAAGIGLRRGCRWTKALVVCLSVAILLDVPATMIAFREAHVDWWSMVLRAPVFALPEFLFVVGSPLVAALALLLAARRPRYMTSSPLGHWLAAAVAIALLQAPGWYQAGRQMAVARRAHVPTAPAPAPIAPIDATSP